MLIGMGSGTDAWMFLSSSLGNPEDPEQDVDTRRMLRFTQGDPQAFEQLFNKYSRAIINFALKFVGDQAMAEDLAQEIFLKVYTGKTTYRAEAKFKTWLYRIASNACISELRKPRYRQAFQSLDTPAGADYEEGPRAVEVPAPEGMGPLQQLEVKEMRRALKAAVTALPENQRLAFILTRYQNLSYQEVAVVLNSSESAVKSLIHRARETLMVRLRLLDR